MTSKMKLTPQRKAYKKETINTNKFKLASARVCTLRAYTKRKFGVHVPMPKTTAGIYALCKEYKLDEPTTYECSYRNKMLANPALNPNDVTHAVNFESRRLGLGGEGMALIPDTCFVDPAIIINEYQNLMTDLIVPHATTIQPDLLSRLREDTEIDIPSEQPEPVSPSSLSESVLLAQQMATQLVTMGIEMVDITLYTDKTNRETNLYKHTAVAK